MPKLRLAPGLRFLPVVPARPDAAGVTLYTQRRLPASRCSVRLTTAAGPSTLQNVSISAWQSPGHALAAAQIAQWFSISTWEPSWSRRSSAMYPSALRISARARRRPDSGARAGIFSL